MADRALEAWISDQLYALVGELRVLSPKRGEKRRDEEEIEMPLLLRRRRRRRFTFFFAHSTSFHSTPLPNQKTGYAESAVVAFIVSLARRAPGPDALAAQLEAQGLPAGGATRGFASELLSRCGRGGGGGGDGGGRGVVAAAAAPQQQRSATISAAPSATVSAAALARRNAAYSMLSDDEEEEEKEEKGAAEDGGERKKSSSKKESRREKKEERSSRRRRRDSDNDDDDDNTAAAVAAAKAAREEREAARWRGEDEDDEGQVDDEERAAEAARRADADEKLAFEERLRARDESKTRKVGVQAEAALLEARMSKAERADLKRRRAAEKASAAGEEEKDGKDAAPSSSMARIMPALREVSRAEYLKKREDVKLRELEAEVADEEALFGGDAALSVAERRELEYKRKVLTLARERKATEAALASDAGRYRLPDAGGAADDAAALERGDEGGDAARRRGSRFDVLTARYREPTRGGPSSSAAGVPGSTPAAAASSSALHPHLSEQAAWEAEQARKASVPTGAKDVVPDSEKYELLVDDGIDFIVAAALAGEGDIEGGNALLETDDAGAAARRAREAASDAKKSERERMAASRAALPIFPFRQQLLDAVAAHQVLIIVGETGSGKTTQIPQYLLEAGYGEAGGGGIGGSDDDEGGDGDRGRRGGGKINTSPSSTKSIIGCTQPRRVAAMSVAARVAVERGCKLGAEVGYSVRFEDCTSDETRVKYLTDGMLLREFLSAPDLAPYSVMMVDEAHERTLHTDVLFGLAKDVARFRPDLKLLISSATLDAEKFSEFFDGAPIFRIPGRRYPVDILYTRAPEADYVHAAVVTVLQIHVSQPLNANVKEIGNGSDGGDDGEEGKEKKKKPSTSSAAVGGDILVFLTGQEEIEAAEELIKSRLKGLGSTVGELIVAPIYANLPSEMQARIFEPTPVGARKVVLATNIAETSLTIDGISFVVDPGFAKQSAYNPRTGVSSLVVTPISKASAQQRAGRAGRTAPGKAFRLYTAWSFQNELEDNTIPEIQRTNLGKFVGEEERREVDLYFHAPHPRPFDPDLEIQKQKQKYKTPHRQRRSHAQVPRHPRPPPLRLHGPSTHRDSAPRPRAALCSGCLERQGRADKDGSTHGRVPARPYGRADDPCL